MDKFFKTSEDIYEFINKEWESTNTSKMGVPLKIMSTRKAKQILKLSKANAATEYLIREEGVLTLVVFETAWDRLSDLNKLLLLRGVFSVVSYDAEKDRLIIDNRPYADLFIMRHTLDANGKEILGQYDDTLEVAAMTIQQIEEEEKENKEMEKQRKAEAKKAAKKQ